MIANNETGELPIRRSALNFPINLKKKNSFAKTNISSVSGVDYTASEDNVIIA